MKQMRLTIISAALLWASHASASETIRYTYDAKGKLVKIVRFSTVNNDVTTDIVHDKADDRKDSKIMNSFNGSSAS